MSKKELLYKLLGALRLEVDRSIIDEIVATANAAFREQLLQQTQCTALLQKIQQMTDDLEIESERYPKMRTTDVILMLNKVAELAAIA